ncbi:MAG: phosphatase PAP2 family protein [Eubacterium sp.]
MQKTKNKGFIIFSVLLYAVAIGLMVFGTLNDLKIDMTLFNPESMFGKIFESFGLFVYWGIWGIAFAIIFVCRRDLNESLAVIGRLLPFVKPVANTDNKVYKVSNLILKVITTLGFFILCGVGWKKLIENVTKNIMLMADKDNLSQAVYFIISFIVAIISIIIVSKIDKKTLKKLEALALAGVLFGIFTKIIEECKTITSRVRFREMVAYSNGFLNEEGLSEGKYSPLTSAMVNGTDFSAFTPWYKIGDDMGIYNRADSFPSGHTTCSFATFLSVLLCGAFDKLKKLAPFAVCVSTVYVFVMGYTRMVVGAHYLTDVAGAIIVGYTAVLIVRAVYNNFTKRGIIGR